MSVCYYFSPFKCVHTHLCVESACVMHFTVFITLLYHFCCLFLHLFKRVTDSFTCSSKNYLVVAKTFFKYRKFQVFFTVASVSGGFLNYVFLMLQQYQYSQFAWNTVLVLHLDVLGAWCFVGFYTVFPKRPQLSLTTSSAHQHRRSAMSSVQPVYSIRSQGTALHNPKVFRENKTLYTHALFTL